MPINTYLRRDPGCGSTARRMIDEQFTSVVGPQTRADLKTVVTELVVNAYRHGAGSIGLQIEHHHAHVRVAVTDEGKDAVLAAREAAEGPGGRGLRIVDALCDHWGAYTGGAHTVWADLPISD